MSITDSARRVAVTTISSTSANTGIATLALATATPSDTADLLKLIVDCLLRLLRRVFLLMTIPLFLVRDFLINDHTFTT
jgi:hypothetical protein